MASGQRHPHRVGRVRAVGAPCARAAATSRPLHGDGTRHGHPFSACRRADEFADLAATCCRLRASYVSGAAVTLDGGLSDAL